MNENPGVKLMLKGVRFSMFDGSALKQNTGSKLIFREHQSFMFDDSFRNLFRV